MKKKFSHKRSAFFSPRVFSGGSIALAVVILFVLFRLVAPDAFLTVTTPFFSAGSFVYKEISTPFIVTVQRKDLYDKNQLLIKQNEALLNRDRALSARVSSLTALVGTTTPKVHGVVANVLARPAQSPYDTLIIDAGSVSGSVVGDVVTAQGGVPIGTIGDISPSTARVVLFSSLRRKVSAWIGTAHDAITLHGTGAGTFIATVPRQMKILVGDEIFIPWSPSFAIGRVVGIDAPIGSAMETLRIRPFVNIFSLTVVEVTHRTMP